MSPPTPSELRLNGLGGRVQPPQRPRHVSGHAGRGEGQSSVRLQEVCVLLFVDIQSKGHVSRVHSHLKSACAEFSMADESMLVHLLFLMPVHDFRCMHSAGISGNLPSS